MDLIIEAFTRKDWERVNQIFIEGIETGNATFTKEPPTFEEWKANYVVESCYVAKINNEAIGWTAIKPVSNRPVFHGVAEVSIYIGKDNRGQGVGNVLLDYIINWSEKNGYWTLQSNIFPENKTSVALHKKFGFKEVGVREKIGKMDGKWRDIILLDRRSKSVGYK